MIFREMINSQFLILVLIYLTKINLVKVIDFNSLEEELVDTTKDFTEYKESTENPPRIDDTINKPEEMKFLKYNHGKKKISENLQKLKTKIFKRNKNGNTLDSTNRLNIDNDSNQLNKVDSEYVLGNFEENTRSSSKGNSDSIFGLKKSTINIIINSLNQNMNENKKINANSRIIRMKIYNLIAYWRWFNDRELNEKSKINFKSVTSSEFLNNDIFAKLCIERDFNKTMDLNKSENILRVFEFADSLVYYENEYFKSKDKNQIDEKLKDLRFENVVKEFGKDLRYSILFEISLLVYLIETHSFDLIETGYLLYFHYILEVIFFEMKKIFIKMEKMSVKMNNNLNKSYKNYSAKNILDLEIFNIKKIFVKLLMGLKNGNLIAEKYLLICLSDFYLKFFYIYSEDESSDISAAIHNILYQSIFIIEKSHFIISCDEISKGLFPDYQFSTYELLLENFFSEKLFLISEFYKTVIRQNLNLIFYLESVEKKREISQHFSEISKLFEAEITFISNIRKNPNLERRFYFIICSSYLQIYCRHKYSTIYLPETCNTDKIWDDFFAEYLTILSNLSP